jgi:hypothetical protein
MGPHLVRIFRNVVWRAWIVLCALRLMVVRPTGVEQQATTDLRDTIKQFGTMAEDSESAAANRWAHYQNRLRARALKSDPRRFLTWDLITDSMFHPFGRHTALELGELKSQPSWERKWKKAIVETPAGSPMPWLMDPSTSGNLVHQAYHLLFFERTSGRRIEDYDAVFEFGCGYGALSRVVYNAGFRGQFITIDLPLFAALARYYLTTAGAQLLTRAEYEADQPGVLIVNDPADLEPVLSRLRGKKSLFFAALSLSEVPVDYRYRVLKLIEDFDGYLVYFGKHFGEVDNVEFFGDYATNGSGGVTWTIEPSPYLPFTKYLVGAKR